MRPFYAVLLLAFTMSCARHPAQPPAWTWTPPPSPAPIRTLPVPAVTAPTPLPAPSAAPLTSGVRRRLRAICSHIETSAIVGQRYVVACDGGKLLQLLDNGALARSVKLEAQGIDAIAPAGPRALAIRGWVDGAILRSYLVFVRRGTLAPIGASYQDTTFLGMWRGRAYLDDWCCNGRPDEYRPATVFSISLNDARESEHIDLAPEPQAHPQMDQPLGQGEDNYLIGNDFYVVVGSITYRYDMRDLNRKPERLATAPNVSHLR
ncbi:MAG TPA: hypothetical protein VFN49_06280 [Candidatus Aquilonibacter sp.]|nr:hypothetical protein [Candidatus Aquilonibacter sp.]